jgi:hypothetical protein
MKQTINGKIYDTETATEIGFYSNDLGASDFRDLAESLYQSKKGQHFLAGSGGGMTGYANSDGNTSWAGSGIHLLDKGEALEWAEQHCAVAVIEQYFTVEDG